MVKMQSFVVVLLVASVLIASLHANPMDTETDTNTDTDTEMDTETNVRVARASIDPMCTVGCTKWWVCRVKGLFFRKCNKPAGCRCSEFAWVG